MTEENLLDRITGESSRRSFLKKGSLASAGLAFGGTGTSLAQDEGGGEQGDQQGTQGFMFPNQFVADARFTVDAQIDWTPQADEGEGDQQGTATEEDGDDQQDGTETEQANGEDGGEGDGDAGNESALQDQGVEDRLQTYVIQYDFSESHYAFLLVPQETEIEEGQTYQLASSVTGGEQPPVQGTVAVNFSPADGGQNVSSGDEGGDGDGGDDDADSDDEGNAGGDGEGTGDGGGDEGDGGDGG